PSIPNEPVTPRAAPAESHRSSQHRLATPRNPFAVSSPPRTPRTQPLLLARRLSAGTHGPAAAFPAPSARRSAPPPLRKGESPPMDTEATPIAPASPDAQTMELTELKGMTMAELLA